MKRPAYPSRYDDNSDDNHDASRGLGYANDSTVRLRNTPVTSSARSWRCGGQGFESPLLQSSATGM
jgi:hypothetical protein